MSQSCFVPASSGPYPPLHLRRRQNVLQVLLGNLWVRCLLVFLLFAVGALLGGLAWQDHQRDPWMGENLPNLIIALK